MIDMEMPLKIGDDHPNGVKHTSIPGRTVI